MKQKQVERILEDRIDIQGMAKDLLAAGFITSSKKKIVTAGGDFLALMHSPKRLEKRSDGWIKDHFLSKFYGKDFLWSPPSLERSITWQEGEDYAAKHGMQASRFEYNTVIDLTKYNPALIEAAKILELKTDDGYWTRDSYAGNPDNAWYVHLEFGDVGYYYEDDYNYVRPVRSSQ